MGDNLLAASDGLVVGSAVHFCNISFYLNLTACFFFFLLMKLQYAIDLFFFLNKLILLISKNALSCSKVIVRMFTMLQEIFISNAKNPEKFHVRHHN